MGRGSLEISGSTSLVIGGQLRSGVGGDWARFVMGAGTSVSAPGGVNFRANGVIASSMYLNGGTLATSSIIGNDFGGGHTVFNGTTVVATGSNADFLDVRPGLDPVRAVRARYVVTSSYGADPRRVRELATFPGSYGNSRIKSAPAN